MHQDFRIPLPGCASGNPANRALSCDKRNTHHALPGVATTVSLYLPSIGDFIPLQARGQSADWLSIPPKPVAPLTSFQGYIDRRYILRYNTIERSLLASLVLPHMYPTSIFVCKYWFYVE